MYLNDNQEYGGIPQIRSGLIKRIMLNELNTKIASKKKFKWQSNKEEKRIKEKITDKIIYLVFNNLGFF